MFFSKKDGRKSGGIFCNGSNNTIIGSIKGVCHNVSLNGRSLNVDGKEILLPDDCIGGVSIINNRIFIGQYEYVEGRLVK